MGNVIRLSMEDSQIEGRPTAYLAEDWAKYKGTMDKCGCYFNSYRKCQMVPRERLMDVIRELSVAGFTVEVDEHLDSMLAAVRSKADAERDKAKGLHDAAVARAEAIDAALAQRGLALYPYQRDGVRWLSHRKGAGLFDEMGLGKTVQALIAAPDKAPMVVVAPAAVKGGWAKETKKWRPDIGFPMVLSGVGSFNWPGRGEIVITNYDVVPQPIQTSDNPKRPVYVFPDWMPKPAPGTLLIFDECHMLKNPRAKRTQACRLLASMVRANGGFVWGLTGTPLLNRGPELWNVLEVIGVAKEAYGARKTFMSMFGMDGRPRPGGAVASALQKVSLMRRRIEVLPDLPEKTYHKVSVPIDPDTRRLADELQAKIEEAGVKLADITDVAALVAATKNTRLDIGMISRVRAALSKAKIGRLLEVVEEYEAQDKPVVVFSAHRGPVDTLGQRDGWEVITGDVVGLERTAVAQRFSTGGLRGLACTIRAAGIGLDGLQRASHVAVFADLEWTPGINQQAEDRICRIGQDRGVHIVVLVADHLLDEKVAELLSFKARIIESAVNASARETVEEQFPENEHSLGIVVKTKAELQADPARAHAFGVPLPKLAAVFERVKKQIKRPSVQIEGLLLKVASSYSKTPGHVQVSNGASFGSADNRYYGRIDPTGAFYPTRDCPEEVKRTLQRWDEDTAEMARDVAAYGHETGSCSFCGLELTDPRSVTVGYGPVCAEKWGLSWGHAGDTSFPIDITGAAGGEA